MPQRRDGLGRSGLLAQLSDTGHVLVGNLHGLGKYKQFLSYIYTVHMNILQYFYL